ncbi:MAG: AmmeMemoRadiSam system protein A [Candidatus Latescibacterota bacterium]|nr:AmmeMemoRadiSam system protein A [Candidatus Latescibacterota bacterium]
MSLCAPDQHVLIGVAHDSITYGVAHGQSPSTPDINVYSPPLREVCSSFVTLRDAAQALRGCIGSVEAVRPLVEDVSYNAYAAAFRDPRFLPLQSSELEGMHLHISVLSELEVLAVDSEQELLGRLRPGVDGLLLQEGSCRSTLLPAVWKYLTEPEGFVAELKAKAGLPCDHWSDSLQVSRYTVESYSRELYSK